MQLNPFARLHTTPEGLRALRHTVGDDLVLGEPKDSFLPSQAVGATVGGAAVGGALGALTGLGIAEVKVHALPVHSVTETWIEPNTQNQVIGKIPADDYSFTHAGADFPDETPTEPVHAQVPILDAGGNPSFHSVTKTFTDHGTPIVQTQHNVVSIPQLVGSTFSVSEDSHMEEQQTGIDSDGNATYSEHEVTDGYWTRFSPKIKQAPVQAANAAYDTKSVSFFTGVDVGKSALNGFLWGAGLGAAAGLAADVAAQTLAQRHPQG